MIRLRNVDKSFPQGHGQVFVLRRVNLEVQEGELVSIMGPSGAGKSTLLHLLGMHDSDWSGEYEFLGEKVHELGQKQRLALQRQNIGFVFQSYHLLDDMTVRENLEIPLSYRNVKRSERQAIVADTLDRFQVVGKKDLYPGQLSGGQQQLVGVARALVGEPSILLADEPTGNLDSKNGEAVMELLDDLHQSGSTICMVTHDPRFTRHAERAVQLFDGQIVAEQAEEAAAGVA